MAEHPVIMDSKQVKILVRQPGQGGGNHTTKESVVESVPDAAEPKKTIGQTLFGIKKKWPKNSCKCLRLCDICMAG